MNSQRTELQQREVEEFKRTFRPIEGHSIHIGASKESNSYKGVVYKTVEVSRLRKDEANICLAFFSEATITGLTKKLKPYILRQNGGETQSTNDGGSQEGVLPEQSNT